MLAILLAAAVTLKTPTGEIEGTLLVPESKQPVPVVLIIAGSGPTDRDGNSPILPGKNNSLLMLAEALNTNGIASLRYDKRGIAQSGPAGPKESDLRFDMYVDDAARWAKFLRGDARFSKLIIAGHSEGSLIGMIAAQRGDVDKFISIAGAGFHAGDIILKQLEGKIPPEMMEQSKRAIASLVAGKTTEDTPFALASLFRPSVQPYLISWFKYDPADEIAKLRIPVLVIQGTTDVQVSVDDAKRLAKTPVIIEGMNHVLKQVPADLAQQQKSYSDPTLPIHPALVRAIVDFVNPH
jgi:pimeloyl-ACP methyl ester carboxylesterase